MRSPVSLRALAPMFALLAVACGAAPGDEPTGKSSQADATYATVSMNEAQFGLIVASFDPTSTVAFVQGPWLDVGGLPTYLCSSSSCQNSTLTLNLPKPVQARFGLPATLSEPVPPIYTTFPLPQPFGNTKGVISVARFDLQSSTVSAQLSSQFLGLSVTAGWAATLQVELPGALLPSPSIKLSGNVTIDLTRTGSSTADQLASKVAFQITSLDADCGAFGWCDGLAQNAAAQQIGSQTSNLALRLEKVLDAQLSSQTVLSGLDTALSAMSNQFPWEPPGGTSSWTEVPGSMWFSGGQTVSWYAATWTPPSTTLVDDWSFAQQLCGSGYPYWENSTHLGAGAYAGEDTYQLERLDSSGWIDAAPANQMWDESPPFGQNATYRVCGYNPAYPTPVCGPSETIYISAPYACGSTGGGGGWGGGVGRCPPGGCKIQ